MKNNFTKYFFFIFFLSFKAFAQSYIFETADIKIIDNQNQIITGKGKATSIKKGYIISSNNFVYKKNVGLLFASGDGILEVLNKNIEIKFQNAKFDDENSQITLSGNVKFYQKNRGIELQTQEIFYDAQLNIINSKTKFYLKDNLGNSYNGKNFLYELNKDLLKINSLAFEDKYKNKLKTEIAFINTKTQKLISKDIIINLDKTNNDNQPRLKGNSLIIQNETSEITKGVFTNCKISDECPPWAMNAEKITHNKKDKIIYYDNAVLKIYDKPVMYFPKFFHPDPTVKRQSGFLIPTIKNSSNSTNFLNIPYFWAISENKDMTISPRFYSNKNIFLQTEYRKVNKESNHLADISFLEKKKDNLKSHFFYSLTNNSQINDFKNSKINLEIQKTSNDTYLKTNKITSDIEFDENYLKNSLDIKLNKENLSINFQNTVFEDLNKIGSDKYEYILPNLKISKKINNNSNLNGDFFYNFSFLGKQYNTNITEKTNINDLIFSSYPQLSSIGFYNNYEVLLKNSNTNGKNSNRLENENSFDLDGIVQFNSSLPLKKENENYQKILKPKLSLKLAPNSSKDNSDKEIKIDVDNIYSLNRASYNDTIEDGVSLTLGNEYSILNRNNSTELFNFNLANNIRIEDSDKLSTNNQINQKTSNIFSKVKFRPNEILNLEYNAAIKNNLNEIGYENFISKFSFNNFETQFEYSNENLQNANSSYIQNKSTLKFNDYNNFSFSTRKNKSLDLTEYYKLIYEYKNDCLSASIEYNKDFYSDRDLKPSENIFLKLTIIPFGEASSPAISTK